MHSQWKYHATLVPNYMKGYFEVTIRNKLQGVLPVSLIFLGANEYLFKILGHFAYTGLTKNVIFRRDGSLILFLE